MSEPLLGDRRSYGADRRAHTAAYARHLRVTVQLERLSRIHSALSEAERLYLTDSCRASEKKVCLISLTITLRWWTRYMAGGDDISHRVYLEA